MFFSSSMTSIRKLVVLACSIPLGQDSSPAAVNSQIYALAARFTMNLRELPARHRRRTTRTSRIPMCGRTEACACATQFVCGAVRSKIFCLNITFSKKSNTSEKLLRADSVTASYLRNRIRARDKAPTCECGALKQAASARRQLSR